MKNVQDRENLQLAHRVEEQLKAFGVRAGDGMIVGVSGGPDSVCLLHLLKTIEERFPIRLHVCHLNHGLRGPESASDARFVQDLADEWKIPVTVESAPVSDLAKKRRVSIQVAAREARYAFLQRMAERLQGRWIALGHTADDQAETFLLRLLRGAGAKGLASVPVLREIVSADQPRRCIIRPLLNVERKQILYYLKARSIPFREDASNLKPVYLRNRLRQEVIPLLTSHYNPNLVETLCRTAVSLREQDDLLSAMASRFLGRLQVEDAAVPGIVLGREGFLKLHPALQRMVLREAIARVKGDLAGITYGHLKELLHFIQRGETGRFFKITHGVCIRLIYDRFNIYSDRTVSPRKTEEVELPIPGEIECPSFGLRVKAKVQEGFSASDTRRSAAFDLGKVHSPFIIRGRRRGDYFFPSGMGGKRKKLQDFFVDQKIPRHERDFVPLLTSSEGVLWVIGWRLDGRFLAGSDSRRVVVVEIYRQSAAEASLPAGGRHRQGKGE